MMTTRDPADIRADLWRLFAPFAPDTGRDAAIANMDTAALLRYLRPLAERHTGGNVRWLARRLTAELTGAVELFATRGAQFSLSHFPDTCPACGARLFDGVPVTVEGFRGAQVYTCTGCDAAVPYCKG